MIEEANPKNLLARNLPYFIEWRSMLWTPAVRWILGDPGRFDGKRVLELGCRHGRMSCLFGLMGAEVLGVELNGVSLDVAWQEVDHWDLRNRVSFLHYDGNPSNIKEEGFDYVFSKSVLVVVPDIDRFLTSLLPKLSEGSELMLVENLDGGKFYYFIRRYLIHRQWKDFKDRFHGVDKDFIAQVSGLFSVPEIRNYYGIVAAIRALKK